MKWCIKAEILVHLYTLVRLLSYAHEDKLRSVSTTRVHGPSSRAVNLARELGP